MEYAISILALIAFFAIATARPINMGILAFAAAFLVGGLVSGIPIEDIQGFFPGDMFLVVFGITLLFGIARVNGTIDLIMEGALRLVRGKPWAIVWLMFLLAGVLMALGSVLAVAMLAPIAMPLAKRYGIDPLLMGMMLSHGALGAAFSPVTVYAVGLDELMHDQDIALSPVTLFVAPFLLNLFLAALLFAWRGRNLFGPGAADAETPSGDAATHHGGADGSTGSSMTSRPDPTSRIAVADKPAGTATVDSRSRFGLDHILTLGCVAGLLVAAVLGIDIGVTATLLGAAMLLARPSCVEASMKAIAWPAVILVCGVVTYMGVLEANGTIEFLGEQAAALPWPLLTALAMFVAVGAISAVGSSFGIILVALPLAAPLLEQGHLEAAGFVVALAFCATVVDVSPLSTNGIIVLASAQVENKQRMQRRMLAYTGYIIVAAPVLALLTLVIPTS